jgi:spore coat protein U-like protein
MKKSNMAVGLSVALLIGGLLTPNLSLAGTANRPLPVSAQVNANCNFTTANTMTFTGYDPTGANALPANPLLSSVVVDVRCTKGAVVTIGIDNGGNPGAAGASRAMTNGTAFLGYDLCHDATVNCTSPWTNSGAGLLSYTSLTNAPNAVTVYGRVLGGQDVPAGTYTDSVQVTINY